MTENDLKLLYFLSNRNEKVEQSLNKIKRNFEELKKEISVEKNIMRLMGNNEKAKGIESLIEGISLDILSLNKMKYEKTHEIEEIVGDYRFKEVYLFEKEKDFENIEIKGLRIKNKHYKASNWGDFIATLFKVTEKRNLFIHYQKYYHKKPYLMLTEEDFHLDTFGFILNNQNVYINKRLDINKVIKDILLILKKNSNYRYNDFSIITEMKKCTLLDSFKNENILNLDNEKEKWTGKKPKYIIYKNKQISVNSWAELLFESIILFQKEIVQSDLLKKEKIFKITNFIKVTDGYSRSKKLKLFNNTEIYIPRYNSAKRTKRMVFNLVKEIEYSPSNYNVIING